MTIVFWVGLAAAALWQLVGLALFAHVIYLGVRYNEDPIAVLNRVGDAINAALRNEPWTPET